MKARVRRVGLNEFVLNIELTSISLALLERFQGTSGNDANMLHLWGRRDTMEEFFLWSIVKNDGRGF